MRDGRSAAQASKKVDATTNLLSLTTLVSPFAAHQITCNTETGAWILIQPTLVRGISLSKDEWRDVMQKKIRVRVRRFNQML